MLHYRTNRWRYVNRWDSIARYREVNIIAPCRSWHLILRPDDECLYLFSNCLMPRLFSEINDETFSWPSMPLPPLRWLKLKVWCISKPTPTPTSTPTRTAGSDLVLFKEKKNQQQQREKQQLYKMFPFKSITTFLSKSCRVAIESLLDT